MVQEIGGNSSRKRLVWCGKDWIGLNSAPNVVKGRRRNNKKVELMNGRSGGQALSLSGKKKHSFLQIGRAIVDVGKGQRTRTKAVAVRRCSHKDSSLCLVRGDHAMFYNLLGSREDKQCPSWYRV